MLTKGAVAKPEDAISPDEAVKDPYVLEFLNLNTGATATKATNTTAATNRVPAKPPEAVLLVGVMVEHITHLPNGLEIFLPSSKTDQDRQDRTVFIPHTNGDRCPVRALVNWLEIAGIKEGYVFRAVTRHDCIARHGLSAQSVALVVKASVARVGGDSKKVSGHSLRAGYCTSAAEKGLQPWQIREQTGHKSDVTLAKYIRPVARRKIPSLL